ncbi:uracil nucleotide/cysteinyl leukotriene receptor [Osmerus eperlanus]|uniref:uracil nucleotide/cysteinyl leukotriene receptor n=1 Tax=Osmerus eperlanus TaxID=29151 RepID=UPI002E0E6FC0
MNYSEEERQSLYSRGSHLENLLFASFYILVFIVATPSNTLALWAFFCRGGMSPCEIFLRNLAIADISYVLLLPLRMAYHLSDSHWPFSQALCRVVGFLFYLNMYCSLYFMTCISLHRLLIVVIQVRAQWIRKTLFAKVVSLIIWVIVIVSMCPVLLSKKTVAVEINNVTTCSQLYLEHTSPKAMVSTIVAFVIPLFTIGVSYVLILVKLRAVKQHEKRQVRGKAVQMIILIMINFVVAFLPYHVIRVIYIEKHSQTHMTESSIAILAITNRIASAMTCVSGVLDPLMYFFLAKTYQNMLLEVFCKDREVDQQTTS